MNDQVMEHAHNVAIGVDNAAHHVAAPAAAAEPAAPGTPAQSPPPPDQDAPHNDPIAEITALIAKLVDNAAEIIPKLGNSVLTKATCHLAETENSDGITRTCILQFNTFFAKSNIAPASVSIEDLHDDSAIVPPAADPMQVVDQHGPNPSGSSAAAPPRKNKKQKQVPRDVSQVRRSNRIAKITSGFFDAKSARDAELAESAEGNKGKGPVDEEPATFSVSIIDAEAAAPPHLPLASIQVNGTSHCKMPPMAVSEAVLAYDSSNDSE
jgi:hypothetical protein